MQDISIKKSSILNFFKYVLYFILFYIFSKCTIFYSFSPAFFGFFLSLIFLKENPIYLSLLYFLANALTFNTTKALIFSSICILVCVITSFIYKKKDKKVPLYLSIIIGGLLGAINIYFSFTTLSNLYISILNGVFNLLFMVCVLNFFKIIKKRKYNLALNIDEILCFYVIVLLFFSGLQNINFRYFDVVKFLGIFLILLSSKIFPSSFTISFSIIAGLGVYLVGKDLNYLTLFCVSGLFATIFSSQNKFFGLSVLFVDVILNLFVGQFGVYSLISFIPTILGCLIYILIPKVTLQKLKSTFSFKSEKATLKNILNQNKLETSKKLKYTAEVFYEMDRSFRRLVKKSKDVEAVKTLLTSELIRSNCENCSEKTRCLKGFNSEIKRIFENLVNIGFEKGRITLLDLPSYLTTRCVKLNVLVSSLNSLLLDYKNYEKVSKELDSSKLLIAEQLRGVSEVLKKLSIENEDMAKINGPLENTLRENFIYNDIVPLEIVCFERDEKTSIVSLILRTNDFDNEKICNILNKTFKTKMAIDELLPAGENNLTYVSYKTAPTYDVSFGVAKKNKEGEDLSGDNHAISKLTNDKFLLALSDGMGSGKVANEKSEVSINLIENFYKAGYNEETILNSVNKLLNITSEDVFSALDISVIDLKSGEIDFIKQGGAVGFVKKGDEVFKVEGEGMPLGIVSDIKIKTTKSVLSPDDMLIMLSDGVVDAFGEENLKNYLRNLPTKNPQEMADTILHRASTNEKNLIKDDMTVLTCKLFYNFI